LYRRAYLALHDRAEKLQRTVGDLSKAFDQMNKIWLKRVASWRKNRIELGRGFGAGEKFIFLRLRKTKREGLLQLFWGEQPPFILLRSVGGGTFFARTT